MRIDANMMQGVAAIIAAFAALLGGMYAVVTRPLLGRLDDICRRLDRIENTIREHGERLTRVEERIPPLVHR